ncbi:hypothetical protein [Streptosporangium vulgare]|uniref:Uncharacterized protein n=1 Tax=Streptosporangium vulgare TaxID=46190 RepID=A0ABV5TQ43_9ACTN
MRAEEIAAAAAEAIAHGLRFAPEAARSLEAATSPAPCEDQFTWSAAEQETPFGDAIGDVVAEARRWILAEVERQGLVPVEPPHVVMPPAQSDDSLMYGDSLSVKMVVWARPPDQQEDA